MKKPKLPNWRVVRELREVTNFSSEEEARAAFHAPVIDSDQTEVSEITTLETWQEASKYSGLPGVWHTLEEKK